MEQRLSYYIDRYATGRLTPAEEQVFTTLLQEPLHQETLQAVMKEVWAGLEKNDLDFSDVTQRVEQDVLQRINPPHSLPYPVVTTMHRVSFLRRTWLRYAAALIVLVGVAAYFWSSTKKTGQLPVSSNQPLPTDIAPGRDKAILTLANGQQILLDSTQGNIVQQGSLTVVNLAGQLKYEGVGTTAEYNTISTPKGGQYQIVLPDGSKVWLNAASSIKFPTAFTSKVRQVEMTGEAYMEIAKNPQQPFSVIVNETKIDVLGTSFNVNAYEDEKVKKTTLIEGAVRVVGPGAALVLQPGQQTLLEAGNLTIQEADLAQTVAWKNGVFQFNRMSLADAMRQLARWYDVEVVYQNGVPDIKFWGKIKRDLSLSQVLEALGEVGVKFKLEGKKLIVL